MKLDTQTLAFILSLAFFTQVIALFIALFTQHRAVTRTYHGIGWWLLASGLMALGALFMPLVNVKSLEILARFANPLLVLGQIFLYIGIIRFLDEKENRWMVGSIYFVFILLYYYYMYFSNSISSRTVVINGALATISFLTAYRLFSQKDRFISTSANFTAAVFFIYGVFFTIRIFWTISLPPIQTYSDQAALLNAAFIVPTVASTLWTFGFILMANQRLNTENRLEKIGRAHV